MPLVDYGSSDEESGDENECEDEKPSVIPTGNGHLQQATTSKNASVPSLNSEPTDTIFSALPKPATSLSLLIDDSKLSSLLLNKKSNSGDGKSAKKESIKISVPSMSEFKDDEDETPSKKPKFSSKNAGLFSLLPPPKHNVSSTTTTTTLVPNSVSKFKNIHNKKSTVINKYLKTGKSADSKVDDEEDDVEVGNSFFGSSLTSSGVTEPETSGISSVSEVNYENEYVEHSNVPEPHVPVPSQHDMEPLPEETYSSVGDMPAQEFEEPTDDNTLGLDEKALQMLCGGKKKRQQMPMNVIDLSGEQIMPDSKEWLLKQFTEEKNVRPQSHKKGQGPSTQQRRKHQITYLAFQAKAQELELQNQWANNRMSRRQTQSKYGF